LDVLKPLGDKKLIESELEGFGIRLNKKPPAIVVRKKDKGGIAITNTVPLTNIDHEEIHAVCSEYKINNADVAIRQPGATADDLVDVIEGNRCGLLILLTVDRSLSPLSRIYVPAIYVRTVLLLVLILFCLMPVKVLNKIDAISIEELDLIYKIPHSVPISSNEWLNVDELIEKMWEALDLVRVYTKPRGLAPDYSAPVVLKRGKCTVDDFCSAIHKEIAKQMK
jgi:ribosome-interacting GTPase 1